MNNRLTNSILIVMLILNVGFIGTWWMTREKHKMHHDHEAGMHNAGDKGMMFLSKQLGFDDKQQAQAEAIFKEHADKMQKYQAEIGRLQKEMFKCISSDTPDSVHAFQYADSIGVWRYDMQKEFIKSSMAIRQICNADQKKKCDELMQNMVKKMSHAWGGHGNGMNHDSL